MSEHQEPRIVVVGASMGGLRAAEQLRAAGWDGAITVVGEEVHPPYNRPPLSKELLAHPGSPEDALATVALRQRPTMETVDWRLGVRVVASDLQGQTVTLASGEQLAYDGLVIASGIRPRRLHVPGPTVGRHVVRTLEDALGLHRQMRPGARVVVVGCGFIGCEVAATARELGCEVHLVEGSRGPMHRVLGEEVSVIMRDWLVGRGIQIVTGHSVEEYLTAEGIQDDGGPALAAGVRLADGTEIQGDVVVEAVGSVPNTEWLEGNGLDLTDGVVVDERLRVAGAGHAVALGDIARYQDPWAEGEMRRVEHWQGAIDMAKTAARTLVADLTGSEPPAAYAAVPSFWSDQFGIRIQGIGAPHRATGLAVLEGSLDAVEDGVVIRYDRDGLAVGVVTIGLPAGRLVHFRKLLGQPTPISDRTAETVGVAS